ncbi:hypothetical protein P691DRAFT_806887 [Macrolepiota fuliginosa MF-IS2]|uniref:G-patch domain-containing protein n=1 Tax=Macrolepiota fuliginosa MF-IS2 TaxID=1400762 RepID=A0A9P5XMD2_9AGAR|nr:hypothetical protein P691DRAFT_806887 [Macrolepiota fuliginosa MF-IS2]
MSESSIARWNAIPMARPEEPAPSLKRKREDDDMNTDGDDDDISLVSRSPSPVDETMDVDPADHISKYDEFVRGPAREVITVETKIKPTNKGFAMLAKMGWSEGQPVGLSGDGRVDPIPFEIKRDSTGLGKTSQDVRMIEETVSQRRELDSERQTKESEDQRRAREDAVARKAAVQDEISTTLRAFYCTLCDKQFKTVAQYDEHTNSYAHHHKARFKDMQANARPKVQEEIDKRKEKERKREERELRKIAAAAGIRVSKTGTALPQAGLTPTAATADVPPSIDADSGPTQKKGGWASIGSSAPPPPPTTSSSGFKKSGWATVGSSSSPSSTPPPPPPEPPKPSGWAQVSSAPPPPPPSISPPTHTQHHTTHTPSFRTGGWTSLDTGSITAQPPPPAAHAPDPHLAAPSHPVQSTAAGGWTSLPATTAPPPQIPAPKPISGLATSTPQSSPAEPKQSGWQKFQAKNNKRR